MNSYSIQIKQNGVWSRLEADSVFPLSWCDLLDERLDEAYITVYNSTKEVIKQTTEIKITIHNEGNTVEKFFIVASDNSFEFPVGSGKYKHDLYLIERTKLLEGIYCSSLTFTNSITRENNIYDVTLATASVSLPDDIFDITRFNIVSVATAKEFVSSKQILYYFPNNKPFSIVKLSDRLNENNVKGIVQAFLDWYETNKGKTYHIDEEGTIHCKAYYNGDTKNEITINYSEDDITIGPDLLDNGPIWLEYGADLKQSSIYCKFVIIVQPYTPINEEQKQYSITDVVCRMCEQAEPLMDGETPRYRMDGVVYKNPFSLFNKSYDSGDAKKYSTVLAPEFTVTQSTLREQLRTVGGYIHGEPYLDEENKVHFKPLAITRRWKAGENLPYVSKSYTAHINEYCTEIRTNAQNLVSSMGYAKGVAISPGEGLLHTVRSEQLYARVSSENGEISTDFPIQEIIKVECGLINPEKISKNEGGKSETPINNGMDYFIAPTDITPFVYEQTVYNANLSSHKEFPISKPYGIYYTRGEKNIKGLFYTPRVAFELGTTPPAIANILSAITGINESVIQYQMEDMDGQNLVFRVTYRPITNHFVSHGKQIYIQGEDPFHKPYNQSENLVESTYFGEHIKGVAARLGNIQQERTYIIKYIKDIPTTGMKIGDYWITAVSCELMPYYIKCTVGLSKNYESISRHIGVNSQKRMYQISESNVYRRDILIKNRIVITKENGGSKPSPYSTKRLLLSDLSALADAFKKTTKETKNRRITFSRFIGYQRNIGEVGVNALLPTISRALGNTIVFTFSMLDNYSAGNTREYVIDDNKDIQGWWMNSTPYTDENGSISYADIKLYSSIDSTNASVQSLWKQANAFPELSQLHLNDLLPETSLAPSIGNERMMYRHCVDKDNREALSYNIVLEFVTDDPDLVIGSGLAAHCSLVDNTERLENALVYRFVEDGDGGYSFSKYDNIFDTTNRTGYDNVAIEKNESDGSVTISFSVPPFSEDVRWVIAFPSPTTDNVLLSGKGAGKQSYTFYITK